MVYAIHLFAADSSSPSDVHQKTKHGMLDDFDALIGTGSLETAILEA